MNLESDAARFLAGMSGGGSARLATLRQTPEWESHQQRMEQLFTFYHRGHLPPIRALRGETGATSPGVLFLNRFGGPDFLFADAYFPGASNLVLVGLEGASQMPDLNALSDAEIFAGLRGITTSIDTVLGAGYFVTKEMRGIWRALLSAEPCRSCWCSLRAPATASVRCSSPRSPGLPDLSCAALGSRSTSSKRICPTAGSAPTNACRTSSPRWARR